MIRLSEEAVGVGPTKQRARARPTRVPGRASCSSQTFPGPLVPLVSPVCRCLVCWCVGVERFILQWTHRRLVSCDATKYRCPSLTRGRRHRAPRLRDAPPRRAPGRSHARLARENGV
eukprot:scaffold12312_cov63-Phaeocystis_antarctica.AAC.11